MTSCFRDVIVGIPVEHVRICAEFSSFREDQDLVEVCRRGQRKREGEISVQQGYAFVEW